MERVLVTGGAGFIGSALIRLLLTGTEAHVLNLDKLTYAASPAALADVASSVRYGFRRVDVADAPAVDDAFASFHPNLVFHLAAESHVDRSIDTPAEFVQSNVVGTFVMLQAALRYWRGLLPSDQTKFRFHHVSTDEVFGALGSTGSFSEVSRYDPRSPYAASKAASDHLVRAWHHSFGLPTLISNCGNNYGPYQFPEKLIPTMILRGLRGQRLPVYGRGDNVRDWIYVDDHAAALWEIATRGAPGSTYLVSGGGEKRNIDVVREICSILDARLPGPRPREELIEFVSDRPGHDHRYALDATRLSVELGWRPQQSFRGGLERTVAWYMANESWWSPLYERALERRGLA